MSRPRKYPQELIERGVRLVIESGRPIAHVATDIGVPAETLRKVVRQTQAEQGLRTDLPSSAEREEITALKRENFELRRANEILKAGVPVCGARARPRPSEVSVFIEGRRVDLGSSRSAGP